MTSVLLYTLLLGATVQDRVFSKTDTVAVAAGGAWLERGDLLSSPGVSLALTHYWDESFAIDYLQATYYFTRERETARLLRRETGYEQTRERPRGSLAAGARYAIGYAKMLLETGGGLVHFAPEVAMHVGVMVTGAGTRPMADAAVGVRAQIFDAVVLLAEYRAMVSAEPEGLVLGRQPAVAVGLSW